MWCKWFAYGPADATVTPSSLASVKSRMVYVSGAGLPSLSWKKAIKRMYVCMYSICLLCYAYNCKNSMFYFLTLYLFTIDCSPVVPSLVYCDVDVTLSWCWLGVKYSDHCVCLLVCLSVHSRNWKNHTAELYQTFVHVACGHGSVVLWCCRDTLCTSGLCMTSCFHTMGPMGLARIKHNITLLWKSIACWSVIVKFTSQMEYN